MKIGIIAEDDSDVTVISEITRKLLRPHALGFKRFVGDGCGKLRRKCAAWARNLVLQGCPCVVVVHDLDEFEEKQLRAELAGAIAPAGATATVILLPRPEIESWLLYDASAIAIAFRSPRLPKLPGNPEMLSDPKKYLRDLVWKTYRKDYLNTVHNAIIAKSVNTGLLGRARSFIPHVTFTTRVKQLL